MRVDPTQRKRGTHIKEKWANLCPNVNFQFQLVAKVDDVIKMGTGD
jgi:hypothetical protein